MDFKIEVKFYMAKSPRLSFKGYKFKEALYRNKDSVKNIVAIIGTYGTYLIAAGFDWVAFLIAIGAGFVALAYKLLQDAVDFYFGVVGL